MLPVSTGAGSSFLGLPLIPAIALTLPDTSQSPFVVGLFLFTIHSLLYIYIYILEKVHIYVFVFVYIYIYIHNIPNGLSGKILKKPASAFADIYLIIIHFLFLTHSFSLLHLSFLFYFLQVNFNIFRSAALPFDVILSYVASVTLPTFDLRYHVFVFHVKIYISFSFYPLCGVNLATEIFATQWPTLCFLVHFHSFTFTLLHSSCILFSLQLSATPKTLLFFLDNSVDLSYNSFFQNDSYVPLTLTQARQRILDFLHDQGRPLGTLLPFSTDSSTCMEAGFATEYGHMIR